jgi:hypothetical protein
MYLGSQINNKNSTQEEVRLRIQAGNRSLFANKKLLKNKDLPVSYRYIKQSYDLL